TGATQEQVTLACSKAGPVRSDQRPVNSSNISGNLSSQACRSRCFRQFALSCSGITTSFGKTGIYRLAASPVQKLPDLFSMHFQKLARTSLRRRTDHRRKLVREAIFYARACQLTRFEKNFIGTTRPLNRPAHRCGESALQPESPDTWLPLGANRHSRRRSRRIRIYSASLVRSLPARRR